MTKFPLILAIITLLSLGALAARPCGTPETPYKWTIREYTYDGPDKSLGGAAAIYSTVALFATAMPRTDWSCEISWPETHEGWTEDGSKLRWAECLDTGAGGRGVDDVVLFAMDWKARTLHLSHTFQCSDKAGASLTATGTAKLDLTCDAETKPSRCTTKSVVVEFDTFQEET